VVEVVCGDRSVARVAAARGAPPSSIIVVVVIPTYLS
jgi:hypothetical protein